MCATLGTGDNEKIEVLRVPEGSKPGDLIYVGDFPRDPVPEINPKKSQWDLVKDKVKTNDNGVAVLDGTYAWKTERGEIRSSLSGAIIS